MNDLVADLRRAVRDHSGATAISVEGNDTTFAEFWAMTGRFAGALRERGLEPESAVALYLPNLPQFVVAFYGVLRAGGVVVPVDPSAGASQVREQFAACNAAAAVATLERMAHVGDPDDHAGLQFVVTADGPGPSSTGFSEFLTEGIDDFDYWEVVERDEDDLAVLAYTAGTTGEPKGVELTHGNVVATAEAVSQLLPSGLSPDDATLGALPFWRADGTAVAMHATLASGAALSPLRTWDAGDALALLDEEGLSVFYGSPSMYDDLLAHPDAAEYDLSSVRLAGVLGGGASVEALEAFESEFGVPVYEGYGLPETAAVTHFNAPSWGRRLASVGKPVPGVFARIVDDRFEDVPPIEDVPPDEDAPPVGDAPPVEGRPPGGESVEADLDEHTGEIVVAGPNVTRGYHDHPADDAFTKYDGRRWFHTGDVGYRDEEDYYYVIGRQDAVADGERGGPGTTEGRDDEPPAAEPAIVEAAAQASGKGAAADDGGEPTDDDDEPTDGGDEPTDGGDEPTEEGDEPTELQDLDGISESRAALLRDAGFESVADLRVAEREDLTDVKGFGDALVDRIEAQIDDDA